MVAADRYQD